MNVKLNSVVAAREPSNRAVELDVLRSAGALSVIVLHASSDPLTEQFALGQASWILLVCNVAARFAVPVFVILSGMGLTLSARSDEAYPRFLSRRLSRILPAYLVWSLIYICTFPSHDSTSVRTALTDLFTGHASHHLYFVPAMVRLYFFYPVLNYLVRTVRWATRGCCVLSWSMIWLSPMLVRTPLGAFVDALLPLRWVGYFALGIALAHARSANPHAVTSRGRAAITRALARARTLAPLVALGALSCMIAIVGSVTEQGADIEDALGLAEPLVLPYSVGVLLWSTNLRFGDSWLVRLLTFVSDHSYAVYLSHVLVLQLCALGLGALALELTPVTTFSTGMLLSIPLALAAAVLSDRAERFLRSLKRA